MARRHGRSVRVYLRLIARDGRRSLNRLVSLRRRRGQLILTLTRPSFRPSRAYYRAWRAQRKRRASLTSNVLVSVLLLVVGAASVGYALVQLNATQAVGTVHQSAIVTPKPAPVAKKPLSLPKSTPVHLSAPDIGLDTDLIQLGTNADGSLETPQSYEVAGWYKYSPTPGEIGPAIITGHVDNYKGPAIFFRLHELQPGQQIAVTREDGTVAHFQVSDIELYDQDHFPSDKVYGNTDYPALRLITCGGIFNHMTGEYMQNTVVYATYVPENKS